VSMSTEMARHLIRDHGVDPSYLGKKAHRITDSVRLDAHRIAIKTPRWGWRIIDEHTDKRRKPIADYCREQPAAARVPEPVHITVQLQLSLAPAGIASNQDR
jgi:hypothetical protein